MSYFFRHPVALIALLLLGTVALASIFGPLFFPANYGDVSDAQFAAPNAQHWLGTDQLGRDIFYRILQGGRVSLIVGFSGAAISLVVGTAYGLISGYAGGRVDSAMMRIVEILYAIPRLIIILVLINTFDPHFQKWLSLHGGYPLVPYSKIIILILCLGCIEWLSMARIVRGQVLTLKSLQYVTAARALGQSHLKILTRHLLPNLFGIVLIYLTLTIPAVILDESFLSFLGLGIQAPQASWGTLLSDGAQVVNPIKSYWWLLLFPAAIMSLTLLALNFLGDALRDWLDPRGKTSTSH